MSPDTITVRGYAEEELDAVSADLHVVVEGSAVFSGDEAFKKAKELHELVTSLRDFGIGENRIKLRTVRIQSQSFAMFKSSSALYAITISTVGIEQLSAVLGAIAARKNAELRLIAWNYSQLKETRSRVRAQALADAKAQAAADGSALGVKLLGVHLITETDVRDRNRDDWSEDGGTGLCAYAGSKGRPEIAFSLGNSKRVVADLQVQFRIGPFVDAGVVAS